MSRCKDKYENIVDKGVVLIPATDGAIAYNLPNIKGGLKLSRHVYRDIFLSNITHWNDITEKAIAAVETIESK